MTPPASSGLDAIYDAAALDLGEAEEILEALGVRSDPSTAAELVQALHRIKDEVRAEEREAWSRYVDFVHELAGKDHDQECQDDRPCLVCRAADVVMNLNRPTQAVRK